MKVIFFIAIGGMFGALSRYYLGQQVLKYFGYYFPLQTIIINVVGSFLIGLIFEISKTKLSLNEDLRLLITVGFLGSFTTFSAFTLDFFLLIEKEEIFLALIYIIASVMIAIFAMLFAIWLVRSLII